MEGFTRIIEFRDTDYPDPVLGISIKLSGKCIVTFSSRSDPGTVDKNVAFYEQALRAAVRAASGSGICFDNIHRQNALVTESFRDYIIISENSPIGAEAEGITVIELHPEDSEYPAVIKAYKNLESTKAAQQTTSPTPDPPIQTTSPVQPVQTTTLQPQVQTTPPKPAVFKRFCTHCGKDLSNKPLDIRFCSQCGNPVE